MPTNWNLGFNIIPKTTNTQNLGSSNYKWNIYANSINGTSLSNIITDVQIDGTSILSNNIAHIPVASTTLGLVKIDSFYGTNANSEGRIYLSKATDTEIKAGTQQYKPIVPYSQHEAVFYGLAKAAGDSTQASSENAVGTYTSDAKTAIQSMLGISSSGPAAVTDIKINNTSILNNNVANIPVASANTLGVVKGGLGTTIDANGNLSVNIDDDGSFGDYDKVYSADAITGLAHWFNMAVSNLVDDYELSDPTIMENYKIGTNGDLVANSDYNTYVFEIPTNDNPIFVIYPYPGTGYQFAQYTSSTLSAANASVVFDRIRPIQVPKYYLATHIALSCEKGLIEEEYIYFYAMKSIGVSFNDHASTSAYGVVQVGNGLGVNSSSGKLQINSAGTGVVKEGTSAYFPIVPGHQHESVFYGLAKAAGDSTQASSSNAVGNYTDTAKTAIQSMLDFTYDDALSTISDNAPQNKIVTEELNKKVNLISETIEGNPCTFNSSIGDIPLKSIKINWTPTQKGTSDPSPSNVRSISGVSGLMVQRTGKNLFDASAVVRRDAYLKGNDGTESSSASSGYTQNYIAVSPNTTYTLSGTIVTESQESCLYYYDISKDWIEKTETIDNSAYPYTFTTPANCYYIQIQYDTVTVDFSTIQIELGESASEYTSYAGTTIPINFPALTKNLLNIDAPFENPSDTGSGNTRKRVFKPYTYCVGISNNNYFNTSQAGTYSISNGTITVNTLSAAYGVGFAIPVKPETTYRISNTGDSNNRVNVGLWASDGTWLKDYNSVTASAEGIFTTVADTAIAVIIFVSKTGGTETSFSNIMLVEGSSSQTYEPYTNIVYGGSLDVATGMLTVSTICYNGKWGDGSDATVLGSNERKVFDIYDGSLKPENQQTNKLCNIATWNQDYNGDTTHYYVSTVDNKGKGYLFLPVNTDSNTVIQICADLATAQTIQLTPQQLTTLIGDNTIWSDTNGPIKIENYVDLQSLKDYIDKKAINDIQINGTSIVSNGVANIPIANDSTYGVTKTTQSYGITVTSDGTLRTVQASDSQMKTGSNGWLMVPIAKQHQSVFYGLAKAAGDSTQAVSSNAVGTYTDTALGKIQDMLHIADSGIVPTIKTTTVTIDSLTDSWALTAKKGYYHVDGGNATGTFLEGVSSSYGLLEILGSRKDDSTATEYLTARYYNATGKAYFRSFYRTPSNSTLAWRTGLQEIVTSAFTGATASAAGAKGLVPAPSAGDEGKFLKGDGTWVPISVMTGATSSTAGTSGLVPAPATTDVDKFLAGDGTYKSGGLPMVILSYGSSTWAEFEAAYNNNVIVYCRASSNSNPATGSQTRMAFMAYVNNATTPTNVEFQYYRSVNSHSATQMGDQVFVYKLDKTSGWSVTTREASIKEINVASGSKLGVSWSSNKVTLSNTMTADDMPMSSSDATTTKSAIDTLNSKIGNLHYKIIENVSFNFSNSRIASKNIADIDNSLTNAKYITGFVPDSGVAIVAVTRGSAKTSVTVFVDEAITGTNNVNLFVIY